MTTPIDAAAVRADDRLVEQISSRDHAPADETERLLVAWVDGVRPWRSEVGP